MMKVDLQNGKSKMQGSGRKTIAISNMEKLAMKIPFINSITKARVLLILIVIISIALMIYNFVNLTEGPVPNPIILQNA